MNRIRFSQTKSIKQIKMRYVLFIIDHKLSKLISCWITCIFNFLLTSPALSWLDMTYFEIQTFFNLTCQLDLAFIVYFFKIDGRKINGNNLFVYWIIDDFLYHYYEWHESRWSVLERVKKGKEKNTLPMDWQHAACLMCWTF